MGNKWNVLFRLRRNICLFLSCLLTLVIKKAWSLCRTLTAPKTHPSILLNPLRFEYEDIVTYRQLSSLSFQQTEYFIVEYHKSLVYFRFHNSRSSRKGTLVQLAISSINWDYLCSWYCIPPLLKKRWEKFIHHSQRLEKFILFRIYRINYASLFINAQWTLYSFPVRANTRLKWIWQAST